MGNIVSQNALKKLQMESQLDSRIPVLLITDIARDVDDILAVMALIGFKDKINLVGIATSGGSTVERAVQTRLWLRHLNIPDDECKVIVGPDPDYLNGKEGEKSATYGNISNMEG